MKRLIFTLLMLSAVAFCASCEKSEQVGDKSTFCKHFIRQYRKGPFELRLLQASSAQAPAETLCTGFVLTQPHSTIFDSGSPEYMDYALRNGDTEFNRELFLFSLPVTCAFADNFAAMHVVSDADWDEAHPAGTLLDDILRVRINSFASFVRGGYDMGPYEDDFLKSYGYFNVVEKPVSELTPADMEMVGYDHENVTAETKSPVVFFRSAPTLAREHTLTLTWTTTDGAVKTASITCTPEVNAGNP